MTQKYKVEELKQELDTLKDSIRFFLKLNLGAIVAFFAFIGFLSSTPNEAIINTFRFKSMVIMLAFLYLFALYFECRISNSFVSPNYIDTLRKRYEHLSKIYNYYLILWLLPVFIFFYVFFTFNM